MKITHYDKYVNLFHNNYNITIYVQPITSGYKL